VIYLHSVRPVSYCTSIRKQLPRIWVFRIMTVTAPTTRSRTAMTSRKAELAQTRLDTITRTRVLAVHSPPMTLLRTQMRSTRTFPKTEFATTSRGMDMRSPRAPLAAHIRPTSVLMTKAMNPIACSMRPTQTSMSKTSPLILMLLEKCSAIGTFSSRRARKTVQSAGSPQSQSLRAFGPWKSIRL
jgi:hypothetical protein